VKQVVVLLQVLLLLGLILMAKVHWLLGIAEMLPQLLITELATTRLILRLFQLMQIILLLMVVFLIGEHQALGLRLLMFELQHSVKFTEITVALLQTFHI